LNAVVSIVAFGGLLAGGPFLDKSVESTSALAETSEESKWGMQSFRGGMELGLWKGLGKDLLLFLVSYVYFRIG
jgi:hypothetical protein